MLSSNAMTPRPRPPAKLRRSSSQTRVNSADWRSPPPYAPFASDIHPTLLGSPIIATSQLIRLEEVVENDEKIQEKSKEELEELLRRASEIIKERERELDMTSETCKTLAENNASLKARNDALISRLPPSQPSSPLVSPSLYSSSLLSPSHSRSSSRSLLLSPKSLSPFSSLSQQPSVRRRAGHARRVSSTPAELAALADQNAELLAKLADLEAEASRSEQAGKRRLRSLEAEIECLRNELERAREESQRLEENMNENPIMDQVLAGVPIPGGLDKQVVKMFKRLSREAKVRELRAKTRPWEGEQGDLLEEPKNFAPNNLTPGLPFTSKIVARKVSAPNLTVDTSLDCTPYSTRNSSNTVDPKAALIDSPNPLSSVPPSATSTIGISGTPNAREQALVSQLLLKIRELEETNAQLAANHLQASIRLREAQTESESVRRLCEFISDEVDAEGEMDLELEVVDNDDEQNMVKEREEERDNDPTELRTETRKTVRLRSVGRKTSMDFGTGSTRHSVRLRKFKSMDSFPPLESSPPPPSSDSVAPGRERRPNPKTRKTVLGLFEEGSSTSFESPALPATPSFDVPFDQHRLPAVREPSYESETNVLQLDSDKDADFDIDRDADAEADNEAEEAVSLMPSLGSELGLELDGLRPAPGLGHVRTKSIMELLHSADSEVAVSSLHSAISPGPLPPSLLSPASSTSFESSSKSVRQRFLAKETQRREDDSEKERGEYFPRLRRMKTSAALRAPSSLPPASRPPSASRSINRHRSLLFQGPTYPLSPSISSSKHDHNCPASSSASSPSSSKRGLTDPGPQNRIDRLRALIFELWLWLYFAAVIVVFIFSMARKGPKVVLSNKTSSAGAQVKKGST